MKGPCMLCTNISLGPTSIMATGKASSFISKKEVWNRESLVDELNFIVEGSGSFICV